MATVVGAVCVRTLFETNRHFMDRVDHVDKMDKWSFKLEIADKHQYSLNPPATLPLFLKRVGGWGRGKLFFLVKKSFPLPQEQSPFIRRCRG